MKGTDMLLETVLLGLGISVAISSFILWGFFHWKPSMQDFMMAVALMLMLMALIAVIFVSV